MHILIFDIGFQEKLKNYFLFSMIFAQASLWFYLILIPLGGMAVYSMAAYERVL